MRILLKENPNLHQAHEKYVSFTMNPELVDAYEARMKWQLDHDSALDDALAKGREEGSLRSKITIAQKMLDKGYDYGVISECTGMDVTELEKLARL